MSTVVLQAVGGVVGGALGGPVGAAIGAAIGTVAGYALDQQLFAAGGSSDKIVEGPRLSGSQILSSEEGSSIPRIYGTARTSGELIWATNFEEVRTTSTSGGGGGKGGGGGSSAPKVTTVSYSYYGNFAIALCEDEISHMRNVWADGNLLDMSKINMRIYKGTQTQLPDSLIAAKQGTNNAPAYRGVAYVVFEHFALEKYGNRIPQFSFEIVRSTSKIEKNVTAITLMPGATEFGYDPLLVVDKTNNISSSKLNKHILGAQTDWQASMDELQGLCPNLERVAIIAPWFGTDLRCGECAIKPGVEVIKRSIIEGEDWYVNGVRRTHAHQISKIDDRPSHGGTPNDASLIRAIIDLKARGLKVAFYPFILMDIPSNNSLPNPYQPNEMQGSYPWRGRITASLVPNISGTPDKSNLVSNEIANFVGTAQPNDFTYQRSVPQDDLSYVGYEGGIFSTSGAIHSMEGYAKKLRELSRLGAVVKYNGPNEWSFRRLILHYAHLCKAAGGVDAFLIGTEMGGMTSLRDGSNQFPFVDALKALAADVKGILGNDTKLTYAADWSEYFGYHPQDGSGDHFFNLDALWADPNIYAIGIDNYMPISDWRDDGDPGGVEVGRSSTDKSMFTSYIAGGEGYDWYYASSGDRKIGSRSAISDGLGKPWVFRYKDLWNWWRNPHYNRIAGVEVAQPTDWQPYMKPFWFTEFGCPAIDKGAYQPNVFVDPKSSENSSPRFSYGTRDDLVQSNYIAAHQEYWSPSSAKFNPSNNPLSPDGVRMVDTSHMYLWCWDVRPFPVFPKDLNVWSDGQNWTQGHWLNGRFGSAPLGQIIGAIMDKNGFSDYDVDEVEGFVDGYLIGEVGSPRAALEATIELYQLVVYEDDGVLIFNTPAQDRTISLPMAEMVENKKEPLRLSTRLEENELPNAVTVNHINPSKEYRQSISSSRRLEGHSERIAQLSVPIVVSETEVVPIIDKWLQYKWIGRERVSFAVSQKFRNLQLGDNFKFEGEDQPWQIISIDDEKFRKIEARAIEIQTQIGSRFEPESVPVYTDDGAGYATVEFIDLPILEGESAFGAARVAVAVEPWRGGMSVYSSPDGEEFNFRQSLEQNAVIGEVVNTLSPSFHSRWDEHTIIEVSLYRGQLSSLPALHVLNGGNTAFIRTTSGRWEVLQFKNAELIGEKRWQLSGLLRGQVGSHIEMTDGVDEAATFVLANEAISTLSYKMNEAGLTKFWRVVSGDEAVNEASADEQIFTPGLVAERPYQPAHVKAEKLVNGDVELSWIRRSRINGDSWNVEEIPLGESREAYLVELFDGATKLREFEVDSPHYNYQQADQTNDGVTSGTFIEAKISQFNSSYGFGPKASQTIQI